MKKLYIFVFFITACSSQVSSEKVKIELAEHYEAKQVLARLSKNGIDCKEKNGDLYCSQGEMQLINKVIQQMSLEALPPGRNIHLGMPGLHEAVIAELEKRNIFFEVKTQGVKKWIIFQMDDLELIDEIVEEQTYNLRRQ